MKDKEEMLKKRGGGGDGSGVEYTIQENKRQGLRSTLTRNCATQRQCNAILDMLNVLKENQFHSSVLCPVKISSKNDSELKTYSDKN